MRATALPQARQVRIIDARIHSWTGAAWTTHPFPPSVRRLIISSSGRAVGHPVRGLRATVTVAARRGDRTPSASAPPTLGGRRRRPDERDPDARQPRLDRARRDDGQLHARWAGAQPPGRGHVPVRHARLHRRPARPAAETAHPDRHRHPYRVPPLPRHRPQDRPRRGRPAARGPALAAPRAVGPARARRRAVAGLGAQGHRRAVPPGEVRRVQPAAVARARASRPAPDRPGRPGGRLRAAPAARRTPGAAEPAGGCRPARLRPDRDLRRRGRGPAAGAGDDLLGGRVPVTRAARDRRPGLGATRWPSGTGSSGCPTPCRRRHADAVGPRRMVSTDLADLAALLPPDLAERPRFGADERPPTPTSSSSSTAACCHPTTT